LIALIECGKLKVDFGKTKLLPPVNGLEKGVDGISEKT
jgi:hypothetical protein